MTEGPRPWQNERLRLEPVAAEHVNYFIAIRANAAAQAHSARPAFANRAEAETFVQRLIDDNAAGRALNWVLVERATGAAIGGAGLWRLDRQHDSGELGYALLPAWWGRGYAREAVTAIVEQAFTQHAVHRIEAQVGLENARSIHLLQSLGFTHEGSRRQNYRIGRTHHDSEVYSLLSTDPRPR